MYMDKLVNEILTLLRELLAIQQRVLLLTLARREAMRTFDIGRLEGLVEQEKAAAQALAEAHRRREILTPQLRAHLGKNVQSTISEIAQRTPEPARSQLLALAGQIRQIAEQVERNNRINATVSESVVKGLAKVLKVVTGLAQHAGLYMRNGRKAALHGIHLLELTA
jgi:hypothetical protein